MTATARVAPSAYESGTAYCAAATQSAGAGFLNRVEVESAGVTNQDEDCSQPTEPKPSWTLQKSADVKPGTTVKSGDTITYTLTVTNTGKTKLKGAQAADDLSKVLSGATFLTPLEAGLTRSGNQLTWSIPNLAPGQPTQVSYRVKVIPFEGTVKLVNVASPTTPGGECAPGQCSTTHQGGGLAVTGAQLEGIVAALFLALGIGAAAIYGGKRRKSLE